MLPVTPGVTPPRLRTKTKKETTSTRTVVVLVVEIDVLLRVSIVRIAEREKTNVVARADVDVVPKESELVVVPTLPLTKVVAVRLVLDRLVVDVETVVFNELLVDVEFAVFPELVVVLVEPNGNILPSTISCKTLVLIVVAMTTPFPSVVCFTGLSAIPKIVWHPKDGAGPKLVAKRLAINVNRLFDAPGAGEVAPENNASFDAMKSPDSAYLVQ